LKKLQSKTEYWYLKKNSLVNWINNGIDLDVSLAYVSSLNAIGERMGSASRCAKQDKR
jgi:hypothetical protein